MKFSLLILLAAVMTLSACTTLANRRDLYSPFKAHGPYTDHLNQYNQDTYTWEAAHPNPRVKLH